MERELNGFFTLTIEDCEAKVPGWQHKRIELRATVGQTLYSCVRHVSIPPGEVFERFMKSAEIQHASRQLFAEISREL